MWPSKKVSIVVLCVLITTAAAYGDEPALNAGPWNTVSAPAAGADPWTATPRIAATNAPPIERLPAYASLRVAANTPLIDPPAPSSEPLPGLTSLPNLTTDPVERTWPEYEVGPSWWTVPGSVNGTNPAANIRNWSIIDEFDHVENFGEVNGTVLQLRFPFAHGRGGLTFEIPYVYADPDFADARGGFSDLNFRISYNFHADESAQWTFFPLLKFYIPTKDEDWFSSDLLALKAGFGRYVLGPGMGLVWTPDPHSFVAWVYRHDFDIAGNAGHPVDRSIFRSTYMHQWDNGVYISPELLLIRNFLARDSDTVLTTEFGYNVNTVTVFTEPAVGLNPSRGDLDWGVILGFRVNY